MYLPNYISSAQGSPFSATQSLDDLPLLVSVSFQWVPSHGPLLLQSGYGSSLSRVTIKLLGKLYIFFRKSSQIFSATQSCVREFLYSLHLICESATHSLHHNPLCSSNLLLHPHSGPLPILRLLVFSFSPIHQLFFSSVSLFISSPMFIVLFFHLFPLLPPCPRDP
jgi:hypothetical protein